MGNWGDEMEMEMVNETLWFYKIQIWSLFRAIAILINFLYKHWINFIYEVFGNQIEDPYDYS